MHQASWKKLGYTWAHVQGNGWPSLVAMCDFENPKPCLVEVILIHASLSQSQALRPAPGHPHAYLGPPCGAAGVQHQGHVPGACRVRQSAVARWGEHKGAREGRDNQGGA